MDCRLRSEPERLKGGEESLSPGCRDKIPQTKWLKHNFGDQTSEIKVSPQSVSSEVSVLIL